jgi:hypothetical protein
MTSHNIPESAVFVLTLVEEEPPTDDSERITWRARYISTDLLFYIELFIDDMPEYLLTNGTKQQLKDELNWIEE